MAVLTLSGCNEGNADLPREEQMEQEEVRLTVRIPSQQSKAAGTPAGEDAVNNVQIFVFDSVTNYLEAYASSDTEQSVELTCKTGDKKVVALVNASAVTDVQKFTQLSKVQLLENTPENLVMYGYKSCTLTSSKTLTVDVSRIVSKVVLKKVEVDFEASQLNAKDLILKGVYLINVPAYYTLPHVSTSFYVSDWYNKMSNTGSPYGYISDQLEDVAVNNTATYETEHFFYSCPNGQDSNSTAPSWSPRFTRIVVEAAYDGVTYYYPVDLPMTKPNTIYDVYMKITRLGSTSPDIRVSTLPETFKVNVLDWTQGKEINEVI